METIQVVLDKKLLKAADLAAKRQKVNRSALIREALERLYQGIPPGCLWRSRVIVDTRFQGLYRLGYFECTGGGSSVSDKNSRLGGYYFALSQR